MTTIRVLLADDHPVVREGLRGMLAAEPDIEVVGEAASGPEAVVLAERLRPDVILMDLRMPGGDGVEATRRLPGSTVVVLTTYDSDADILRAVEAGAAGYLLKDTPRAVLADRVRAAARGETVLAPAVAGRLFGRMRAEPAPAAEQLSARETEVLALVARGPDERGDRAAALRQRGHGEDAPAAGQRQARRLRPDRRRDQGDRDRRPAGAGPGQVTAPADTRVVIHEHRTHRGDPAGRATCARRA